MKKIILTVMALAAASCQTGSGHRAGGNLMKASLKVYETASIPDDYIAEKYPPFPPPVHIVRVVTLPISLGGFVVAAPLMITGMMMGGMQ